MDILRHMHELALRAAYTGTPRWTRFLEPSQERDALSCAREAGCRMDLYGGYDDAERRMAGFWTDEKPAEAPIAPLLITWNEKFASPGHRDLLGSVMALGIERDTFGDIVFGRQPGTAYLFSTEEMADYFIGNLERVGRTAVKVVRADRVEPAEPEGVTIRLTVSQLRLDAIVAAGCRLSRSEAQKLIVQGLVKVNHIEETRTDAKLTEGDLLSIRGHGRLRIQALQGETRRGRLAVTVFKSGK
ncbi:MAG: hypothetical protein E7317_07380 [Clostridiales bacterium]|nr:hypothetical protein [Clostridiales bacterium]